ncbi:TspO/MBR family protein [Catellatospora sp. NPDC049609]|uniref:TspO/MBR family protein n=1 Tax=Catellatospora sp. NPDC049609 TaxID=3155505 RepID=UPI0034188564
MSTDVVRRPPGSLWALAGFGLAVLITAVIGGLAAADAGGQYAALAQPAWAPPSWLFGPVWTVLYVLIAISGWLVWRRTGFGPALWVYAGQLVLNALWTPLFFGAGWFGWAFAEITVLWLAIGATVVLFARISRAAAWLLVPYWLWVSFAAALNFAIWQLNQGAS